MRLLCPTVLRRAANAAASATRRSAVGLAFLATFGFGFAAAPARAQDEPRLVRIEPGGLVVSPASGEIEVVLLGENLWDADRLWTERNVRIYARQTAGNGDWVRLYNGTGDVGQGAFEDSTADATNGRVVESSPERCRLALPARRWLDRKGSIEFKIVRGVWRRAGENRWRYQDAAASNVLRLPVGEAPHRAPDLRQVSPERLPARDDGTLPTIWVRASDLTLEPRVTIGGEDCPLTRLDVSIDFVECRVPETILKAPDSYAVTVTTPSGVSTGAASVLVVAPPAIADLAPRAIPAKGSDAVVVVRFTGSEPESARMRRIDRGGWTTVPLRLLEPGAVDLEVPASLRGFAGEVEVQLENLAGATRRSLALCADEGPNPSECSAAPQGTASPSAAETVLGEGAPSAGRPGTPVRAPAALRSTR
jgi:hypothetical protein